MMKKLLAILLMLCLLPCAQAEEIGATWLTVYQEDVVMRAAPGGPMMALLGYQVLEWRGEVRVDGVLWYRIGHPRHGEGYVLAQAVRPVMGLDEPARVDMRYGPLSDELLGYCEALHRYQLEQGFLTKVGVDYVWAQDVSSANTRVDLVRMMYEHGLIAMDARYTSLTDEVASEILRVHYGTDDVWAIFTTEGVGGTCIQAVDWHGMEAPTFEEKRALRLALHNVETAFEYENGKVQYFRKNW